LASRGASRSSARDPRSSPGAVRERRARTARPRSPGEARRLSGPRRTQPRRRWRERRAFARGPLPRSRPAAPRTTRRSGPQRPPSSPDPTEGAATPRARRATPASKGQRSPRCDRRARAARSRTRAAKSNPTFPVPRPPRAVSDRRRLPRTRAAGDKLPTARTEADPTAARLPEREPTPPVPRAARRGRRPEPAPCGRGLAPEATSAPVRRRPGTYDVLPSPRRGTGPETRAPPTPPNALRAATRRPEPRGRGADLARRHAAGPRRTVPEKAPRGPRRTMGRARSHRRARAVSRG